MAVLFKKAERRAQKLKLGISGPSGSGKSLGALALATGLAKGGKVAAIDTENGSLSLYADRYEFDTLDIRPPYLTKKYLEAMEAAAQGEYAVLLIDSISHQWDGAGGILQRKDEADTRPNTNHWTNWGPFTKEHESFRAAILQSPMHIIATMRSKMAYTQSESGGKKKIEKLGLAPIQREGFEYEFAVTFDIQMDHRATASKDRTSLFAGGSVDLTDTTVARDLLAWLDSVPPEEEKITQAQRRSLFAEQGRLAMPEDVFRKLVTDASGVESTKDIPAEKFSAVMGAVQSWKPTPNGAQGALV